MLDQIEQEVECKAKRAKNENNNRSKVEDKRKSKFWNHFAAVRDDNGKIMNSLCNYCGAKLVYNGNNGTSSMKKHLGSCKKYPYNNNVDRKQKLITIFKHSQSDHATISNWEFDQHDSRLAIAKMIIIDEQPFSFVEREGFRLFCSVVVPQLNIPSRFTVARDCKKLYVCEKLELKFFLKGLKSRIALTTDCWTSNQNFNYACLTAHFIDENWKLHKRILNFQLIDSHKGKEIGKVIEACIVEWGIEDKLSCLTVDNASSNDLVIQHLKENFGDKLVLGGEFFHMRCAAHVLNLIVRDGLSIVKDSLASIRGAIKYVRSSPSRAKLFANCSKFLKVPFKGHFCLDVSTRWNSTYLMLDSALKCDKVFKRYAEEDLDFAKELKDGVPRAEDWINAKTLTTCLKQFYEATKRMSGTLYVTANMHFHEIFGVLASLLEWQKNADVNLRVMSEKMREKFNKYYGDFGKTNVMVMVVVVLDPRYKLKFVKFAIKKIYDEEPMKVEELYNEVESVVKQLFAFYFSNSKKGGHDFNSSSMIVDGGEPSEGNGNKRMKKLYDEFDEEEDDEESEKSELDIYLAAARERKDDDNFDILSWWRCHNGTYKVLAIMARDILAIPISTVSSESTFSTSGRVLDQFRSSLGPKTVEVLICAQDWLRSSNIFVDIEHFMEDVEKYEAELTESGITEIDEIMADN